MQRHIDLSSSLLKIVIIILRNHLPPRSSVSVFGSRATGKAKKFSDIDLVIESQEPLSLETLAKLNSDFEESDLPYKVDIVDEKRIDEAFREKIKKEKIFLLQI